MFYNNGIWTFKQNIDFNKSEIVLTLLHLNMKPQFQRKPLMINN